MRLAPNVARREALARHKSQRPRTQCLWALGNGSSPVAPTLHLEVAPERRGARRRLILMRHADSEDNTQYRDYDRPISDLGKLEAASFARNLKLTGWLPDLIVGSNAKRTRQTLEEMAEAVGCFADTDSHFLGSLYTVAALDGQTRSHLQECLLDIAGDKKNFCIMCIGHNKGWEEAASSFAGQAIRLKTATAALLESAGDTWDEVLNDDASWSLVQIVSPE